MTEIGMILENFEKALAGVKLKKKTPKIKISIFNPMDEIAEFWAPV